MANRPLVRLGDQAHLVELMSVEADLGLVVGVDFEDPSLLDPEGQGGAERFALEGDPEVLGELGMAADAVGVPGYTEPGLREVDGELQLAPLGENGMGGLPSPGLQVSDDEDLRHVAQGHPVPAVGVRRVRLGESLGGVDEARLHLPAPDMRSLGPSCWSSSMETSCCQGTDSVVVKGVLPFRFWVYA